MEQYLGIKPKQNKSNTPNSTSRDEADRDHSRTTGKRNLMEFGPMHQDSHPQAASKFNQARDAEPSFHSDSEHTLKHERNSEREKRKGMESAQQESQVMGHGGSAEMRVGLINGSQKQDSRNESASRGTRHGSHMSMDNTSITMTKSNSTGKNNSGSSFMNMI